MVKIIPKPPANVGQKWGQCGKFVNDWNQKLWLWRLYGDSLESKTKHIDSKYPIAGGDVIIRTGTKYGHVGKVVDVNPTTGIMTIIDSNWDDGTEKVQKRFVRIDSPSVIWFNNKPAQLTV